MPVPPCARHQSAPAPEPAARPFPPRASDDRQRRSARLVFSSSTSNCSADSGLPCRIETSEPPLHRANPKPCVRAVFSDPTESACLRFHFRRRLAMRALQIVGVHQMGIRSRRPSIRSPIASTSAGPVPGGSSSSLEALRDARSRGCRPSRQRIHLRGEALSVTDHHIFDHHFQVGSDEM